MRSSDQPRRCPVTVVDQITTAEQLLKAPGLGRCELLRGVLVMMSSSGFEHGRVVMRISGPMFEFVERHALGVLFGAETGFQISRDPATRTVTVYRSLSEILILAEPDTLTGDDLLPGFEASVAEIFRR
jgi:Uma2 family endonuclease